MKAIQLTLSVLFLFGASIILNAQDHSALSMSKQTEASYYYARTVDMDFDATVQKVKASLKEQGFGIVSEINMQEKLKKGTGKDVGPYLILGACHPPSAYEAMQMEERIGVMLPCNVIVRKTSSGKVEVASINPEMTMKSIGNPKMEPLANEITVKLQKAINNL
jgi:uncharacterized protein (DUF302 family)